MSALAVQIETIPVPPQGLPVPIKRKSPADIVAAVIRNNDNDEATMRHYALEALEDGRAAFWLAAEGYAHQTAECVQHTACRLGSLDLAIEEEIPARVARAYPGKTLDVLNLLIPLNAFAEVQLMDAYEAQCTFFTRNELADRRTRVSPMVRAA